MNLTNQYLIENGIINSFNNYFAYFLITISLCGIVYALYYNYKFNKEVKKLKDDVNGGTGES